MAYNPFKQFHRWLPLLPVKNSFRPAAGFFLRSGFVLLLFLPSFWASILFPLKKTILNMRKAQKIVFKCKTKTGRNLFFKLSNREFEFLRNLAQTNGLTYSEAIFELYL